MLLIALLSLTGYSISLNIIHWFTNRKIKRRFPKELTNRNSKYVEELKIATISAIEAGQKIRDAVSVDKIVEEKKSNDFVTETDKANEKLILGNLKKKFPSYKFIGEVIHSCYFVSCE